MTNGMTRPVIVFRFTGKVTPHTMRAVGAGDARRFPMSTATAFSSQTANAVPAVSENVQNSALLATAYFSIASACHALSPGDDAAGFFWLPAGLLLASLLLSPRSAWPALLFGAFVGDAAFGLGYDLQPSTFLPRFCATAFQALFGALATEQLVRTPFRIVSSRELMWFLFWTTPVATLLGATLGVWLTGVRDPEVFEALVWPRWGSSAMGVLVLAPHMLAWSDPSCSDPRVRWTARLPEALLLVLCAVASIVVVFQLADGISSPLRIVLAAPVIWAGLRFGVRGVTSMCLALSLPVAFFTGAGVVDAQWVRPDATGAGQTFIALLDVIGLMLALVIQESREQLSALSRSETRFRLAMEHSPIGMATVARDGRFIDVNPALCRITGYDADELRRKDFQSITHPDDLDADLGLMAEVLAGERDSYRMEKRYIRKDGATIWVQLDVVLVARGEPRDSYFLSKIQDVTSRKDAERKILELNATLERRVDERTRQFEVANRGLELANRELEVANRELEAFSAAVSHDLRSPLRLIEGFAQMLSNGHIDPRDAEGLEDLARIRSAARRMDERINGMLRLARLTRGPLASDRVDLSAIARETVETLAAQQPERTVRVSIEPGLVVRGSATLLGAVMENLLGNAWKFTSKKEHADLAFGQTVRGGQPMFFVRDNGAGFSMEYADQLFRAFHRLHDEEDFPGSGIGLITVQRILQRYGGRIEVDAAIGKGACFYFTVPDPEGAAAEA
jgi:PAS domain S-box-containing protein